MLAAFKMPTVVAISKHSQSCFTNLALVAKAIDSGKPTTSTENTYFYLNVFPTKCIGRLLISLFINI